MVNEMSSEDSIYRELQQKIDKSTPAGFPASEDGTDIKILKLLYTPEEVRIAMNLEARMEPLNIIHGRASKNGLSHSIEALEEILDGLVKKGAIISFVWQGNKLYSLVQFAVGFFEDQLGIMTKEFAELANKYMLDTFYKAMHIKGAPPQLHTIPIEKSLTVEHHTGTYDSIRNIITNQVEKIAIRDCVCREEHDILEESCKLSDIRRCCVMFDRAAESVIKEGTGEEVSKEEFFDLLDKYQKAGFVLQPQNTQNPGYMCVCCGCCCGVLLTAKQFPKPAEYYFSNYYAESDSDLCTGCEVCLERCQMDAITMEDEVSNVNLDRCIGCGNCIATCGSDAMILHKRENEIVPPQDRNELHQKIFEKRVLS
ncbi:MAG TPA: 4Fe-4S dicluster domain-containing protein [bacterium]|nr:4Fe-4S dicluster domain-containing protein [bacterium]